jgi:ABC-type spermidine/putrescine transport system permease subunit II
MSTSHRRVLGPASLGLLLIVAALPPLFVVAYALCERWDRSLWPEGFTLQWFAQLGDDARVTGAAMRTLLVAVSSSLLATVLGTAATLAAHMYSLRLQRVLDLLAQLPYAIAPVVIAISALEIFVGQWGALIDLRLLYVLLLAPLLFPLVHRTVGAALQQLDLTALLEAGRTLGAPDRVTVRKVVLPMLLPAMLAAYLLCLMVAALEFPIANLLLGGENLLLQPLMNGLRVTSGHLSAALIVVSFALIAMLGGLVLRLVSARSRP